MRLAIALAVCFFQGSVHGAAMPSTYFGSNSSDNGAYTSWLETASYVKSAFLSSSGTIGDGDGVALHWKTDDTKIHLAVAAKATGWVAFGLGESGSMLGADIVMYSAQDNTLVDSYVLDQAVYPLVDDCQSWTLDKSTATDGFVIFEATRLLDTNDMQDRVFVDDSDPMMPPPRVLAAWGDTPEPSYHGNKFAKGAIRFFGSDETSDELELFAETMAQEAEGNFFIHATNFLIPADTTTYQVFCFSRDDLLALNVPLDEDLHLIGYEAVLDPRTVPFVHHFDLMASSVPLNTSEPCTLAEETAYAWAPGRLPFMLPSNVGGPLGLNGYQSFTLEIHYNNPNAIVNQLDSSGVRMYYTSKKRKYDMGVISLGDPEVYLLGERVSTQRGLAQHVFDCDSACSSSFLNEPVTVILESLHMHMTGVSMVNVQIRNGQVLRQGVVEYWDFNQQGDLAVVQPPFTIEPGDSFRTTCSYMTTSANETWGLASSNEMCQASLYYFPRRIHPVYEAEFSCGMDAELFTPECLSTHTATPEFSQPSQLQRSFGTASAEVCSKIDEVGDDVAKPATSSSPGVWTWDAVMLIGAAFLKLL